MSNVMRTGGGTFDYAHRLQLQERLCHQIADEVAQIVGTNDVAVLAKGRHLCMEMRGIRTPGLMTSSITRGIFRESSNARMEFLQLVKEPGHA